MRDSRKHTARKGRAWDAHVTGRRVPGNQGQRKGQQVPEAGGDRARRRNGLKWLIKTGFALSPHRRRRDDLSLGSVPGSALGGTNELGLEGDLSVAGCGPSGGDGEPSQRYDSRTRVPATMLSVIGTCCSPGKAGSSSVCGLSRRLGGGCVCFSAMPLPHSTHRLDVVSKVAAVAFGRA